MTEQEFPSKTTTIDKRSWFQRLGSSVRGILTGLVLFILAFPILIWNEGRDIQIRRSLKEGAAVVETSDAETIDPDQDGKLIHFTGEARTPSVLNDDTFAISENALKLKRIVEIYQWSEEKETETVEKIGGGTETTTSYTYKQVWDDRLIDSQSFQEAGSHRNPVSKPLENFEQVADLVSVGAYTLPTRLLDSLSDYQRLDLSSDLLSALPYAQQEQWQIFNNYLYQSQDPSKPEIADVRVWYQILRPGIISVISQQKGETLQPHQTANGKNIEMIRLGEVSAEAMFEGAVQSNRLVTWIIRLLGFFMIYVGINTLLIPLSTLLSVIPFFANIFRFASKLLSAIIALVLSLIVIGVSWLLYRPLIGLAVLLLAILVVVVFNKFRKKG
jgi:hypothetical protein